MLTSNAELIQIYDKGNYCTVVENELLYLLKTTQIIKENIIATCTVDGSCTIYNRDLVNCFVDYCISKDTINSTNIEELPETTIKSLVTSCLESDIIALMKFSNRAFSGNFERIFNKFSQEDKEKILEGLQKLGVYKNNKFIIPWMQISSIKQIEWSNSKLFSFIKLNAENMHYDICSRTINGGYIIAAKNGSCCTDKKFSKDLENKCYIIFDVSCISTIYNKNIIEQIKEDAKNSSYYAANKFVKIEEKLIKDLDILIEKLVNKKLFVDMSKVKYPNIDALAEQIAKYIKAYQKLEDASEKSEVLHTLKNIYIEAYKNLQESQASYEKLYNELNEEIA